MKSHNEYAAVFGKHYRRIPKAVFAAIAFSFAVRIHGEQPLDEQVDNVLKEWHALYENGIVPQIPPGGSR